MSFARVEILLVAAVCAATTGVRAQELSTEIASPAASATNSLWEADAALRPFTRPVQQTGFETALAGCGSACGCGDCSCGSGGLSLLGLNFVTDHCFDDFVEPITNPLFFTDPRARTRARFLFINQMIPEDSILGGGDLQVFALQVTFALSERLAIIAEKDGYINLQADGLPNSGGWADLGTGLKYVLIRDPEEQFLLTAGFMLEWANGSGDVFQGNGDGVWNFFLTTGKAIGDYNFIGTLGWHLPNHGGQESESIFYSLHLDRPIVGGLSAVWEMTGIHYTQSGRRLPGVQTEGGDLINLGAGDVAGNHFVSMAFGAAWKINCNLEAAAAWEFPLTGREDLFDNRTTFYMSWVF